MIEENKIIMSSEPEWKRAWWKDHLQYLDGSIVILAVAVFIISYTYYAEYITETYIVVYLVVVIGLYYGSIVLKKNHQPATDLAPGSHISNIIMLSENGSFMKEWVVKGKVAVLIGKNTKTREVNIDLSESMYDALIQNEHAVMNFAAGNWYLEGLHTPSSISLKKANDKIRYRLTGGRPCKLEKGDIVYIANTRLLLK